MSDLAKMTKGELTALVADQQKQIEDLRQQLEALKAGQSSDLSVQELIARNERLTLALLAEREAKKQDEVASRKYRVTNVSGAIIAFTVTEENGLKRRVRLARDGQYAELTEKQIRELYEKSPHFFEKGYLSAPDVIADSPNAIPDIAAFVRNLSYDDINERIGKITSLGTLWRIFNYIENQRFIAADEHGRPFTESDGDRELPVLKEVELDQRLIAIEMAVQRRIATLLPDTNAPRVSLDA